MPVAARHFRRSGKLILATLMWALGALVFVGFVASFVAMLAVDREYAKLAAVFLGAWVILRVTRFVLSRKVTCPLCHGHILQKRRCRMHQEARRLGPLSYRQSLFLNVATRARFTCMFCGTPYRLKR